MNKFDHNCSSLDITLGTEFSAEVFGASSASFTRKVSAVDTTNVDEEFGAICLAACPFTAKNL